jgi:hypothetical protein
MEEIRNKIAESGLIALDLADFKAKKELIFEFDVAQCLWQGLVLKEKDFRDFVANNDWTIYQDKYVYVHCSADAIVPTWAYMLIGSKLFGIVKSYCVGTKDLLEKQIIIENIKQLDLNQSEFESKRYIIKGCADISDPAFAMTELMKKLQVDAKSIMYGEPCSTVPIYKKKP